MAARRAVGSKRPRGRAAIEREEDERLLTLHLMLQVLVGRSLTVELRDGGSARGTLKSTDDVMK